MRRTLCWIANTFVLVTLCFASQAQASPIKLQPIAVTASKTYSGSDPSYAADGKTSTAWNAGAGPSQWIQYDLGRTAAVRKIRLLPSQLPNGYTTHLIQAGQDANNLKTVTSLTGYTYDGQWVDYLCNTKAVCGNVRYIKITTTQSPSWVGWKEIEVYQGVEYIGYFGDAFEWLGDYIGETTASGTNLVWIAGTTSTDTFAARLQEATAHGAKAVLVLSTILFSGTTLRSDWQSRWATIASIVRAAPANSVAALYPVDEPIGPGYLLTDLTTVISRVRQDFPTIPIGVIFSPGDMGSPAGPSWAALFDWIGFDCYRADCDLQWYRDTLRSWQSGSQRLVAVPWAYRNPSQGTDIESQNANVTVIGQWQKEITSDPSYVAVFPFLWESGYIDCGPPYNCERAVGTADLPLVKARMYEFTQSILHPSKRVYSVGSSASTSYPGMVPFLAFDGDSTNAWNAGGGPTAWILADLGGNTRVNSINLRVAQNPAGRTTHTIEGLTPTGWSTLGVLNGSTQENTSLMWSGTADISQVRITTSQSPSWVSWHEIQLYRN
jgi:hypothetical protein